MDPHLRLRFANTALLTGLAILYLAYDTGFRFWVSQSDAAFLQAMTLRHPAALKDNGGAGLAFEAAAEATSTPALQTYLYNAPRWTRATTAGGSAEKKEGAVNAAHASVADLPMAAVVVESSWLSPDHASVSASYAQRLLEGYRSALLTGAPWLLLTGTAEESALGLQHLRRLARPAEALFGPAAVSRWPVELQRLAEALYESMLPYDTLGAWVCGAGTRPIPSFLSPPPPASPSAALRSALRHLLSVSSLTDTATSGVHGRPSALELAAAWLQRHDGADVADHSEAEVDTAATDARVTVYATANSYTAAAGAPSHGDTLDGASVGRQRTVAEEDAGDTAGSGGGAGAWESARVRLLRVNGTHRPVHVTLPGIIAVAAPDENARARYAAAALQQLLEKTLVHRHALLTTAPSAAAFKDEAAWWWWIGQPHGVTVVGGAWEQQRIKLIYIKALREAAAETQAQLRRAVQDIHHARCQFEGGAEMQRQCRGTRGTRLPPSALPFARSVPAPPQVFILPPAMEEMPKPEEQPEWLNYTGELPATINPNASRAARAIGRWSFFLYVNYRRWMDWFLASLPTGVYQDHFVLASILMSDLAEHRISWRDAFFALWD